MCMTAIKVSQLAYFIPSQLFCNYMTRQGQLSARDASSRTGRVCG